MTDSEDDAREYALKLLSYRGRSERELSGRLREKGYNETTIRGVILYLKDRGFINDSLLAAALKRDAEEIRLLGTAGTRNFLRLRGIPPGIIDDVFLKEEPDELGSARKLVEKRLRAMQNCSDKSRRSRLFGMLLRRGYSSDTIREALRHINIKEERDEEHI